MMLTTTRQANKQFPRHMASNTNQLRQFKKRTKKRYFLLDWLGGLFEKKISWEEVLCDLKV